MLFPGCVSDIAKDTPFVMHVHTSTHLMVQNMTQRMEESVENQTV